jgi:hypothetical protein
MLPRILTSQLHLLRNAGILFLTTRDTSRWQLALRFQATSEVGKVSSMYLVDPTVKVPDHSSQEISRCRSTRDRDDISTWDLA